MSVITSPGEQHLKYTVERETKEVVRGREAPGGTRVSAMVVDRTRETRLNEGRGYHWARCPSPWPVR